MYIYQYIIIAGLADLDMNNDSHSHCICLYNLRSLTSKLPRLDNIIAMIIIVSVISCSFMINFSTCLTISITDKMDALVPVFYSNMSR